MNAKSAVPIVDAAMEVLREQGPLTTEDWAARLAEAGHGSVQETTEAVAVLDHPLLVLLADGRCAALDVVLDGRVFTHRLTASEVRTGLLDALPDLAPLVLLAMAADDGPVRVLFSDYDADEIAALGVADEDFPENAALLVEKSALQGLSVGDLVALGARDGMVVVHPGGGEPAPAADLSADLARIVGPDNADNLETVVWQLLSEDETRFAAPTTPLGELVEAAGYECEGDYIASRGFDFAAHHLGTHIATVAREHDLHPDEVAGVISFVRLVATVRDEGLDLAAAREEVTALAEGLSGLEDPAAAAAALDVVNGVEGDPMPAMYTAALAVAERGARRVKASGNWLAGMAADALGDIEQAERHYADAVSIDEEWVPALFELAQIASDRGDAQRGLSLLSRIDGGDSERLYGVLQRFAPAEHPELGRNDPCWCGSGRKYKVCHLGKSDTTLDERAHWLYDKAAMYARSTTLFDLVWGLAALRAGDGGDDSAVAEAFEEPVVLDVALFEGGLFELFVTRRRVLLPADERDLADRWLQVRRSVHEVVAVGESTATLRDLATGAEAEVEVDEPLEIGALICARVVPTGARTQILGGAEPVAAEARDTVLAVLRSEEVQPEDVIDVLS